MSDLGFPVFETARQPLQLGSILGWDFLDPRPIYLLNTINALFSFLFFFSFSFLSFFQLILAGKTLFTFFLSVFLSLSLFLSLFLSLSLSLSLSLPVSLGAELNSSKIIIVDSEFFGIVQDSLRIL